MRRVIASLAISFGIEIVLNIAAIAIFKDWLSACFFVVMMWPAVWFAVVVKMIKESQRVDMIKMQTYWNIDAMRHKLDNKP